MRKPAFCICENKDADQLRGNRCFRYTDSTNPILHKSEISSLQLSSVAAQHGLSKTWSETPKTGFLRTRLIFNMHSIPFLKSPVLHDKDSHIISMSEPAPITIAPGHDLPIFGECQVVFPVRMSSQLDHLTLSKTSHLPH